MTITAPQLKRLQILYGQFERHTLDAPGTDRLSRLQWATQAIGREIASFKDLTLDEAKRLIDRLQGTLGVKAPNQSPRKKRTHDARKQGTEGRRDQLHAEITLVSAANIAMIERDLERLGWTQHRLDAFLKSPRGPLKGRGVIRTLGDANKVHWALKHIKPDERIAS